MRLLYNTIILLLFGFLVLIVLTVHMRIRRVRVGELPLATALSARSQSKLTEGAGAGGPYFVLRQCTGLYLPVEC